MKNVVVNHSSRNIIITIKTHDGTLLRFPYYISDILPAFNDVDRTINGVRLIRRIIPEQDSIIIAVKSEGDEMAFKYNRHNYTVKSTYNGVVTYNVYEYT